MPFTFPAIPQHKIYNGELTTEQVIQKKAFSGVALTNDETAILEECDKFYEEAFTYLRSINLSVITTDEKDEIIKYLHQVFNSKLIFQNGITLDSVFRVSFVRQEFLIGDRIKDPRFLSYPPLDIITKIGAYGRANSDTSTRFYSAFDPYTAVLETKPSIGDRIILTHWRNRTARKFTVFPLSNIDLINNEGIQKATSAFTARMSHNHPAIARSLGRHQKFLAEEFVKSVPIVHPKKYEYLYSAFFSDFILSSPLVIGVDNPEGIKQYDGIIYPSVACKHELENIVFKPEVAIDLVPYQMTEWRVLNTAYDTCTLEEAKKDILPFEGDLLRHSMLIQDGVIMWNDELGIPT